MRRSVALVCLVLFFVLASAQHKEDNKRASTGPNAKPQEPAVDEKSKAKAERADSHRREDERDRRSVFIGRDAEGVRIRSTRRVGRTLDKIEVTVKPERSGTVRLFMSEYLHVNDSMEQFKFQIMFKGLQEFNDSNDNGVLDAAEERQTLVPLRDVDCMLLKDTSAPIASQSGSTSEQATVYHFKCNNTVFCLRGYVSTDPVELGSHTITPNSVKFDIIVTNFPFVSSLSKLALIARAKSKIQMKEKSETGATVTTRVQFGDEIESNGYFGWTPNVLVGAEKEVVAVQASDDACGDDSDSDSDSEEGCKGVAFAFNATAPAYIEWDPETVAYTIDSYTGESAAVHTSASSVLLAVVAIVSATLLRHLFA